MLRLCVTLTLVLSLMSSAVLAGEVYVDNQFGRDAFDGTIETGRQGAGPVQSLQRAAELAGYCGTIILKNNGTPYYDSLSLTGERNSGTSGSPFIIIGNGATVSGLRTVPRQGWQPAGAKIWKLNLSRKGYYQFLRAGQLLPEYVPELGAKVLETLPAGHWVSWRGYVYFKQDDIDPPANQDFAFTADQTGISLHHVSHVEIRDLTLQHFRFDGVHAQGLCDNVQLDNVTSIENGRAGFACSGASKIELIGGSAARNGRHQILVFDRSVISTQNVAAE